MKRFKKLLSMTLIVALMLSIVACSTDTDTAPPTPPSEIEVPTENVTGKFIADTYTSEGIGMNGSIWLETTFTEDEITDVVVKSHFETAGIGANALPIFIEQLIETQNIEEVDSISGATKTYEGFVEAINSSYDQALGNALEAEEVKEDESITTDVVVVGSGMSGISAAVSAARTGADVVLLEKKSTIGTAGHSITAVETSQQAEEGIEDSWEDLADFWIEYGEGKVDEEMIRFVAKNSAESIDWLSENGVDFVGVAVPPTNPFQVPKRTHVTTANRNGQAAYILPLEQTARELGVDIRLETRATKLIQDDNGVVTGVIAENAGRTVTVSAGSVVLATGGFGNNSELARTYIPMVPNVGEVFGASTGDGLIMAKEAGAELIMPGGSLAYFANKDGAGADNYGQAMYFNLDGERFIQEDIYFMHRGAYIMRMNMSNYHMLYDSDHIDPESLEKALENGTAVKGDTIEEVASKLGVNASTLKNTVDEYNGYCETGIDEQFRKPASKTGLIFDPDRENDYDVDMIEKTFDLLNPIKTSPFYAVKMEVDTTYMSGTHGGPKVDLDAHVLDVNGDIIPGLFAVGELANGQYLNEVYPVSGTSLSFCVTLGRYGGEAAALEAMNKR